MHQAGAVGDIYTSTAIPLGRPQARRTRNIQMLLTQAPLVQGYSLMPGQTLVASPLPSAGQPPEAHTDMSFFGQRLHRKAGGAKHKTSVGFIPHCIARMTARMTTIGCTAANIKGDRGKEKSRAWWRSFPSRTQQRRHIFREPSEPGQPCARLDGLKRGSTTSTTTAKFLGVLLDERRDGGIGGGPGSVRRPTSSDS
jgi:hypothetical protein